MYKGNVLETISPKKQEYFKHWLMFSCACGLLLVGCMVSVSVRQWLKIHTLQQKVQVIKNRLNRENLARKDIISLELQSAVTQKKIEFLQNCITHPKTPYSCIDVIAQTIPEEMRLTACSLGVKKTVELRGKTMGYRPIVIFIEALHASACFKNMYITQLYAVERTVHDREQLFDFTIKGFLLKM